MKSGVGGDKARHRREPISGIGQRKKANDLIAGISAIIILSELLAERRRSVTPFSIRLKLVL